MPTGHVFFLNPANEEMRDGSRRRPAIDTSLSFQALFLLPFFVAGLFLIVLAATQWLHYSQMRTDYALTSGRFVDRAIDFNDGRTDYLITYHFAVGDRPYVVTETVGQDFFYDIDRDLGLQVRYDRSDPGIATVVPLRPWTVIAATGFAILWNLLILPVSIHSIRRYRLQRLLSRKGIIVPGVVTANSVYANQGGDTILEIYYRLRSPDSHLRLTGKASRVRNDLKGRNLPPPGTALQVAYISDTTYDLL